MMLVRPRTPAVEACQWTGENLAEIRAWLGHAFVGVDGDEIIIGNRSGRVRMRLWEWAVKEDGTFSVYEPILFHAQYEDA